MKHYIQLGIHLNENLGITSVMIEENTTDLSHDSELVKKAAITILKKHST